jgi:hypothetical protein
VSASVMQPGDARCLAGCRPGPLSWLRRVAGAVRLRARARGAAGPRGSRLLRPRALPATHGAKIRGEAVGRGGLHGRLGQQCAARRTALTAATCSSIIAKVSRTAADVPAEVGITLDRVRPGTVGARGVFAFGAAKSASVLACDGDGQTRSSLEPMTATLSCSRSARTAGCWCQSR